MNICIKVLFILSFCLSYNYSHCQTIEKVFDFEYVTPKNIIPKKNEFGMSASQNRPFLLNMEMINDSLKINSFLPIGGSVFENGKESYQFSGGFNLITSNYFNSNLESLAQRENVFVNLTEKPSVVYEFHEPVDRKKFNLYSIESGEKFYKNNKSLIGKENLYPFQLVQKGSGMLKTKNAFLQVNKLNFGLKATGFGQIGSSDSWSMISQTEWENKTKNLYLNDNLKANQKISHNKYITLVNRINPDDRNWTGKYFNLIVFDSTGLIQNMHQIDFEYIRGFNSIDKVYDERGNIQGFILSFKSDDQLAGKKFKDPIGNKINVYYFNAKGELEFKIDLIHGNKDDYFNPSIVLLKNNQLHILNNYIDYAISSNKDYIEKLIIDKTGKISSENLTSKIKTSKGLFPSYLNFKDPVFYNGYIYMAETKFTQSFENVKTYTNSIVSKIKVDFTEPEVIEVFNKGPQKDLILSNLVKTESSIFSVVCYADGNQIVKIGASAKPLEISYNDSFQPLSQSLLKNFVVDKNNKNIYFVQEKSKAGLAKIIKVTL